MKKSILVRWFSLTMAGACFVSWAQAGEIIMLRTTPVSDGSLMDTKAVWDQVPNKIEDSGQVLQVGSNYGRLSVGIVEFSLPPLDKLPGDHLVSAKLVLNANAYGPAGEAADEVSTANADVDIYGYADTNADGILDYADWKAGEKLGKWLEKSKTITGLGTPMPEFDVTKFVQAALEAKKPFVGFRLQPENAEKETQAFIVIRTAEFSEDMNNAPALVLEFE